MKCERLEKALKLALFIIGLANPLFFISALQVVKKAEKKAEEIKVKEKSKPKNGEPESREER